MYFEGKHLRKQIERVDFRLGGGWVFIFATGKKQSKNASTFILLIDHQSEQQAPAVPQLEHPEGKYNGAIQLESVHKKIDFNGFCFVHELLVNDIGEPINFKTPP